MGARIYRRARRAIKATGLRIARSAALRRPWTLVTPKRALAVCGGAALLVAASAAAPPPAHAGLIPGLDFDVSEDILVPIVTKLFGVETDGLGGSFMRFVTHLEDVTDHLELRKVHDKTTAMSIAIVSALGTLAVAHYLVSGVSLTGAGGITGFEAVTRTCGALGAIAGSDWICSIPIRVSNAMATTLIPEGQLDDIATEAFGSLAAASLFPPLKSAALVIAIILALGGLLLILGLIMMRIFMWAGLAFLYVMLPIFLAFSPFPGTAWMSKHAMKTYIGICACPACWAGALAAYGAVGTDALNGPDGAPWLEAVLEPCCAIALLMLLLQIPPKVMSASEGASMGNGIGQMVGGLGKKALGAIGDRVKPRVTSKVKDAVDHVRKATSRAKGHFSEQGPKHSKDGRGQAARRRPPRGKPGGASGPGRRPTSPGFERGRKVFNDDRAAAKRHANASPGFKHGREAFNDGAPGTRPSSPGFDKGGRIVRPAGAQQHQPASSGAAGSPSDGGGGDPSGSPAPETGGTTRARTIIEGTNQRPTSQAPQHRGRAPAGGGPPPPRRRQSAGNAPDPPPEP